MSITDFLNARIAEDEAVAREYQQYEDEVYETAGWFNCTRVLAECAAKRAIVEAHEAYAQEAIESTGIAFVGARVGQQATGDILLTLAAVYADHDEYQDEWRVGA